MKSILSSSAGDSVYEQVEKCELCGSTVFDPELKAGNWILCRCRFCSLVFTSPRYANDYVLKKYQEEYYAVEAGYLKSQLNSPSPAEISLARALYKRCCTSSSRKCASLDVGCGAGRIVSAFRGAGWDAWGCDQSLKAVEEGKLRGLQLYAGDPAQTPHPHFDLITAFHVLEHTVHPRDFLKACLAGIRPGGFFLVEVPDYGCRKARAMKESWPHLDPERHLYQFTALTLERMLTQTNFRVIEMSRVGKEGVFEKRGSVSGGQVPAFPSGRRGFLLKLWLAVRRIPGARPSARYLLWSLLGLSDSIRILAAPAD